MPNLVAFWSGRSSNGLFVVIFWLLVSRVRTDNVFWAAVVAVVASTTVDTESHYH